MKSRIKSVLIVGGALFVGFGILKALAFTPLLLPSGGGTGISTAPLPGQTLIGNASNTYSPAYLICSGNCSVATSSAGITISVPTASVTTTINGTQSSAFRIIGDGITVTSTVSGATTTFSLITAGDWSGTWQGVNSTTFYLASNPNNYISSSTGNTLYYPLNSNPAGYQTSSTVILAGTNPSGTVKWTLSVDNLGFLDFNVTGTVPGSNPVPYNIPLFNCPAISTTSFASTLSNFECSISQSETFPDGSRNFIDHTMESYSPFFGWGEFYTAQGTSSFMSPYFIEFTDKSGNHAQPFSVGPVNSSTNSSGYNFVLNNLGGETDMTGFLFQSGDFLQSGGNTTLATTTVNGKLTASKGATVNGPATLASTTNALLLTSASGVVSGFAGSNCAAGSVATGISATGTVPCITTSTLLAGYVTSTVSTSTANIWSAAQTFSGGIASPLTIQGAGANPATSTIYGSPTSSYIANFNGSYIFPTPSMLALTGCMGSSTVTDAGGCINYIKSIAVADSNVLVGPWNYSYTTPILLNAAGKKINVHGSGGGGFYTPAITNFIYTATSGRAYTWDVAQYSSAGIGLYDLGLVGPAGVGNVGSSSSPTNTTSTVGVYLGGPNGAAGFTLHGVQISGFGKCLQTGDNTYIINIEDSVIQKCGMAIYQPAGTNVFENDKITNSLIGDCNAPTGSIASNCFYVAPTTSADFTLTNNDFDDAQITVSSTNINNVIFHLNGNHFEPPNTGTGCYDFITGTAGQIGKVTIYSSGNTYMFNGAIGNCPEMINNGGSFVISGDTIASYSNNATTSIKFVNNQDAADSVSWFGLNQSWQTNASQTTFVYGANPLSAQGLGLGSSAPVYSVTTSSIQMNSQYYSAFASSTASTAATTINWNNSNVQEVKLTTSTTFTFSNANAGARYLLMLLQDGTGSRTVTWPASVQWPGGTAPTLTTAANKLDIVSIVCAGVSSTNCYAGSNLNYSP